MYVDAQTVITASGVLGAIGAFIAMVWKLFAWINHQKEQDTKIESQGNKIKAIDEKYQREAQGIQEEQTLIVYGLLACLQGLQEKGCNGPVTEAINKIEKYINKKAHDSL